MSTRALVECVKRKGMTTRNKVLLVNLSRDRPFKLFSLLFFLLYSPENFFSCQTKIRLFSLWNVTTGFWRKKHIALSPTHKTYPLLHSQVKRLFLKFTWKYWSFMDLVRVKLIWLNWFMIYMYMYIYSVDVLKWYYS